MTSKYGKTEVQKLEPAEVWRLFAGIAAIPHASKREERIREHVRHVAEGHGLTVREDAKGNMVIDVPASPGCEAAPVTVLQGHLDMVCEKNNVTEHDFDRQGIHMVLDQDPASGDQIVRADGTTLGADNGIGVAMALAAALTPEVMHGPLELLLTVDEEAGMTGAKALTADFFEGRRLLNLDSEEDDAIYIGCAGGADTTLTWDFAARPVEGGAETVRMVVSGLRGGHSGGDIHENRGNANKLLVRALMRAGCDGLRLGSISGGSKRNVIPREATAVVSGRPGALAELRRAADQVRDEARLESPEPDLAISVDEVPAGEAPVMLTPKDTVVLLAALAALPHGVLGMSRDVPGLVETSNNVATINTTSSDDGTHLHIEVGALSRSSSDSLMRVTCEQITAVGRLAGANVETGNTYPGWQPNMDSPVLATCRRVYEEIFAKPPGIAAIHAGLECGIIGERVKGMDMVSFGPRIEGAHSPDERVYVASVKKSWEYLVAVLAELARG